MKKITIVTPSYNQADFIEDTIESVLSQDYKNIEYIIIDGGSTDGSAEIIKKYEKHLHYWVSEPDEGQAAAISKGFEKSNGDVLAWLNSDDVYLPGSLSKVMKVFNTQEASLVYGDYLCLTEDGRYLAKPKISFDFSMALYSYLMIGQPSSFWSRDAYEAVGGLDLSLNYVFDYDFFLKIGKLSGDNEIIHIDDFYSVFRLHEESKTVSSQNAFSQEMKKMRSRYYRSYDIKPLRKIKKYYYLFRVLEKYYRERGFVPLKHHIKG